MDALIHSDMLHLAASRLAIKGKPPLPMQRGSQRITPRSIVLSPIQSCALQLAACNESDRLTSDASTCGQGHAVKEKARRISQLTFPRMFDEQTRDLADRLYTGLKRRRERDVAKRLEAITADAARRGVLGAGFYHKSLADALTEDLRLRADDLWRIAQDAMTSSDAPLDASTADQLKEFIKERVDREAGELTEVLSQSVRGYHPPEWLLRLVVNEVPGLTDSIGAAIDLFVRRTRIAATVSGKDADTAPLPDARRVFVVHGRDARIKADVVAFLRALGLDPIEWSEAISMTAQGSPYIGEVLSAAFRRAQAAIVLLSPDDEVRLTPALLRADDTETEREIRMQARPNVLFEAGMAFAHQPDRTILVEIGSTKPFSDVTGRHAVRLTNDEEKRRDLANRLKTAGCAVKPANEDWLSVGNFEVKRDHPGDTSRQGVAKAATTIVKYVDLEYPHDSGIQGELEKQGFRVRWCVDSKLSRRLDIDGWSLVKMPGDDGSEIVLKLKDRPEEQTLIKKLGAP
jgi:predicted nucleotide-binding protein